jgi:hypothetical protein
MPNEFLSREELMEGVRLHITAQNPPTTYHALREAVIALTPQQRSAARKDALLARARQLGLAPRTNRMGEIRQMINEEEGR